MIEKMKTTEQAAIRAELYGLAGKSFEEKGYTTETISDGMLVHLGEGQYCRVKVSYCTPEKFDLDHEREVYAQKMKDAAERAEKARLKAEEKERKAKEKAAKAAEKTPEE